MGHTKDELPKTLTLNQAQTDIGFLDDLGIFIPIHTRKLADETIHRYNNHDDLLEACKIVSNSIFQDRDGEWRLSRPMELLGKICDEAIAKAK